MTWRHLWALLLLVLAVGVGIGHIIGTSSAPTMVSAECEKLAVERVAEHAQELDRDKNQCVCGHTQTCSFGPGVVGTQACRTDAFMVNVWSRCEPDPSWRKPE